MKILITGASGKVGESLTRFLQRETDHDLVLVSSEADKIEAGPLVKKYQMKITNAKDFKKICFDERPQAIVNCSAMTDVDGCEEKRKQCWDLNVTAVENMVSICKVIDAHLIVFSTDYIFDGKKGPYDEEGYPDPLSYYGKSKHAMENYVRAQLNAHTVIRTNVVYGRSSYGKNDFIRWVINKLRKKEKLNIITGQYCNPTLADDIARGIVKVIEKKRYGVYNFAGNTWLNRYQIAVNIAEIFGYDKELVSKMDPQRLKQKAVRPEKGGLVPLKAEADLNMKFSTLESGLIMLKQRSNAGRKYLDKGEI